MDMFFLIENVHELTSFVFITKKDTNFFGTG